MASQCACGRPISANKPSCASCLATQTAKHAPGVVLDGVLEILNVQGGDVKVTFDVNNPQEAIRAKRIIKDMLRCGYALIVEVERDGEKKYERVQEFDAERGEYIIADLDAEKAAATVNDPKLKPSTDTAAVNELSGLCHCGRTKGHRGAHKGVPYAKKRLSMETTKATAVGRSAGG